MNYLERPTLGDKLPPEQLAIFDPGECRERLDEPSPAPIYELAEGCDDAAFECRYTKQVYGANGRREREIWVQNESMKVLHERFLDVLRQFDDVIAPEAVGGMPGLSPLDNVERHIGNRYFYTLDLIDAFNRVRADKLASILHERIPILGEPEEIQWFLNAYAMKDPEEGGLVTGASSSVELFNIYLRSVDDELRELCGDRGITYSRYIDDLTFSTPDGTTLGKQKRRQIREVIENSGLGQAVSHHKSGVYDLHEGRAITITGIQLSPDGSHHAPEDWLRSSAEELRDMPRDEKFAALASGLYGHVHACRGQQELAIPHEREIEEAKKEGDLIRLQR